MASAWGLSWGAFWGNAWGAVGDVPPPTPEPLPTAVSGWGGILSRFKQRRQTLEELEAERIKLGILPPKQQKIADERIAVARKLQESLDAAQRSKAAADEALLWELHAYEALLAAEYRQLLEQAIALEKARRQEEEDVAVVLSMLAAMA